MKRRYVIRFLDGSNDALNLNRSFTEEMAVAEQQMWEYEIGPSRPVCVQRWIEWPDELTNGAVIEMLNDINADLSDALDALGAGDLAAAVTNIKNTLDAIRPLIARAEELAS